MNINEYKGKYFGTEIDESWWKRYKKNKLLARGNGVFSYDENSIHFLRSLTTQPIVIEFERIKKLKIGKWHAGQRGAGKPIIKILWEKDNLMLNSGFSLSTKSGDMNITVTELNNIIMSKNYKQYH